MYRWKFIKYKLKVFLIHWLAVTQKMIPPDNPLSKEFPISETLKDIYHVNFA